MKATVYSLTSDVHNSGTDTEVFGTEKELNEAIKVIMVDRLESFKESRFVSLTDTEKKAVEECRILIESGQIDAAWEIWQENIKREDDYYWTSVHDIDVPDSNPAAFHCNKCGWKFVILSNIPNTDAYKNAEWLCPHCSSGVKGGA